MTHRPVFQHLYNTCNSLRTNLTLMLHNSQNFVFVRYGDGEFNNIYKYITSSHDISDQTLQYNCDGNYYYNEQGKLLLEGLEYFNLQTDKHQIYLGMWIDYVDKQNEFVNRIMERYPNLETRQCFFDLLHFSPYRHQNEKEISNQLIDFYKQLRQMPSIIYIGNQKSTSIATLFNAIHINVPTQNAFTQLSNIISQLTPYVQTGGHVFVFSCGYLSKVLIYQMHKLNFNNTYIDLGTAFDYLYTINRDFQITENFQLAFSNAYMKLTGCQFQPKITIKAYYGTNQIFIDVTEQFMLLFTSLSSIIISNQYFGDPVCGHTKYLLLLINNVPSLYMEGTHLNLTQFK